METPDNDAGAEKATPAFLFTTDELTGLYLLVSRYMQVEQPGEQTGRACARLAQDILTRRKRRRREEREARAALAHQGITYGG